MKARALAAAALCMGCAFSHAGDARRDEAEIPRVYPVPKRIEATGGVSRARPGDARFLKADGLGAEGYRIVAGPDSITVEATTGAGRYYAFQTLRQLASRGAVPCCVVEDAPDIALRGVVEGFYGRPWGTEGRLALMDFMGECKMNCFIYGPKDDPYHHSKWKEPYPEEHLADFRRLLEAAARNHVNFYWAIHLGNAFADPAPAAREAEYAALWGKLEAMYGAGFRSFAVFFDDFGKADAALHAEICNRVKREFLDRKGDCSPLIVCPNDYTGDDRRPYSHTLGEQADEGILIMWTGLNVCCEIGADASAKRERALRRPPFVWWNWPVNDFQRSKLLMGRTYGVEEYPFSGFVSNPMENLEASKVALFGVADMVWNRRAFDSVRNWHDAVERLYPFAAEAMLRFCEHNSDPSKEAQWLAGWHREESERFAEEWKAEGVPALARECRKNAAAAKELSRILPEKAPALWREIRYWVALFGSQAREGLAAIKGDATAYVKEKDAGNVIKWQQKSYFQSLAPEWDRKNCVGCLTGTRHLQSAIDSCARAAFRGKPNVLERYFRPTGSTIGTIEAVNGKDLHHERGGALLVLDPVFEQLTAQPDDWFGFKLPNGTTFKYVWLAFDTPDAVANGRIDVSNDGGRTWRCTSLEATKCLFKGNVDETAGFNAVRWANASGRPVDFKIVRFNVDLAR